jgi:Zn-dependent protease
MENWNGYGDTDTGAFYLAYCFYFDSMVVVNFLFYELPTASYWTKGALAALLLFASVLFHELAHSVVARKYKISIESITLFTRGDYEIHR